jgi:hypothetical protein
MAHRKPLDDVSADFDIPRRTLQRWLGDGKLTAYRVEGDRRRYLDIEEVRRLREPQAPSGEFWTIWVRLSGVPAAAEARPVGSLGPPFYTQADVDKLTSALASPPPRADVLSEPWLVSASLTGQDIEAIFCADYKPNPNELVPRCMRALAPRIPQEFVWLKDHRSQIQVRYEL